jgi:hypothetical protein
MLSYSLKISVSYLVPVYAELFEALFFSSWAKHNGLKKRSFDKLRIGGFGIK